MDTKDLTALLHMLIPPVKESTFKGVVIWLLEILARLLILWFVVKILGFHIDIGIG
jgi:hypothetical protein